jgi:DNA helicase HerA-like ATPase
VANREISALNQILRNTSIVQSHFTKQFLLPYTYQNEDLIHTFEWVNSINMYFKMNGYTMYQDDAINKQNMISGLSVLAGLMNQNDLPFVYTLHHMNKGVSVYYGINSSVHASAKQSLQSMFYECDISNEWIDKDIIETQQTYSKFIVSDSHFHVGDIDTFINSTSNHEYMINMLCVPMQLSSIENEINLINNYLSELIKVTKNDVVIGSQRTRQFQSNHPNVENTIQVLNKYREKLVNAKASGVWQTMLFVSSSSEQSCTQVAQQLAAHLMMRFDAEKDNSLTYVLPVNGKIYFRSNWKWLTTYLGHNSFEHDFSHSLANSISGLALAQMISLPIKPHKGIVVKHIGDSKDYQAPFNKIVPMISTNSNIELALVQKELFYYPLHELRRHAFVCGSSRMGKSTTVQKLLVESNQRNIPFIVIESAKKEYWELIKKDNLSGIKVYSCGSDARVLYMNPFEPEDGVLLDTHIKNLKHAFLSLFDRDDPLPQLLELLLYIVYEKKGWSPSERISKPTEHDFPIIEDMLTYLDEAIASINGYSERLISDLRGFISLRIKSIMSGNIGQLINTRKNISISSMYESSAIIELDDVAPQDRGFFASLIAIKINQFSRFKPLSKKLERLLVIEEAHHILPNPELKSTTNANATASQYFAEMLAEISAYGTGVIVVEQRPSIINPAALANCATKIIHNLGEGTDMSVMIQSLSLSKNEASFLGLLRTGEAIMRIPDHADVFKGNIIADNSNSENFHIGQVFLSDINISDLCRLRSIEALQLCKIPRNFSNICSVIDRLENKYGEELSLNDIVYISGNLAEFEQNNPMIVRQILYDVSKKYSKRNKVNHL